MLHGACYVFGPEFIRLREDAFNPRTFLYFEEDILAYECLMSGMPMRYTPRLRVVHLEDVATDMAHRGAYAKERLKRQELYRSVGVLLDEQREDAARIRAEAAFRPAPGVSAEQTGMGYAGNAVNVAAFRHDPLVWRDSAAFAAYYGLDGHVRLSVRTGSVWRERNTGIEGSVRDADRGNLPEALPLRRSPEGFVPGTSRLLSASPPGAWEPNADPAAWRNGTVAVLAQYARHVPDHRVALDFDMPVYALHFSAAQEGEHTL